MADLALFYYGLLGFAILLYVILDGFDLGIGVLYGWFADEHERDVLMKSVAPVWDGNETWLVFGGVVLLAAFPSAYAGLLSALYLPVVLMLVGLIFRGVAFEYRFKSKRSKHWWNRAFAIGSVLAAACQGLMLGVVVHGLPAADASSLALFSPLSLLTMVAVPAAYALLASCYLILKCQAPIQARAAQLAQPLLLSVAAAVVAVLAWHYSQQDLPNRWQMLALLVAVCAGFWLWWQLRAFCQLVPSHHHVNMHDDDTSMRAQTPPAHADTTSTNVQSAPPRLTQSSRQERLPFWTTVLAMSAVFVSLLAGLFPDIIPGQLTYLQAAAPLSSLQFMLVGVLLFLPLILTYTCWGYRIFTGKVEQWPEGY